MQAMGLRKSARIRPSLFCSVDDGVVRVSVPRIGHKNHCTSVRSPAELVADFTALHRRVESASSAVINGKGRVRMSWMSHESQCNLHTDGLYERNCFLTGADHMLTCAGEPELMRAQSGTGAGTGPGDGGVCAPRSSSGGRYHRVTTRLV